MRHLIKYNNRFKIIPALACIMISLFFLSSCLKDNTNLDKLHDSPPLVGFLFPSPSFYPSQGGYLISAPLSYSTTPQTVVYDSTQAYPGGYSAHYPDPSPTGADAPWEIELSYTSFPNPFKEPVTVTVGVDPTEVAEINAADGTNFLMLPSGSYTLPNNGQITIQPVVLGHYPTVVIFPQVTTSMLDTTQQYLLPLKIVSVQQSGIVIASNLNRAAMQIVVK
ncbi:MAG: DUF1735 domain-containing protein [Chitinophagaceae bacterium]